MRTGIVSLTYVYYLHIQPWVINTYHITRLEREKINPKVFSNPELLKRKYENEEDDEQMNKRQKLDHQMPCTSAQAIEADNTEKQISNILKSKDILQMRPCPWIRVNGSLNRRVLDRWLNAILLYCMSVPGCKITALCTRFKFLFPVTLFELLEVRNQID